MQVKLRDGAIGIPSIGRKPIALLETYGNEFLRQRRLVISSE
jgi:hypothetical protein